ncbi:MAG: hypothetical protein A2Y81_05585 [Nitrospirae bacterium RBG_13_43_8]|nr:MAG: hypothetical protein A2Y81_05585 [Nitrospirae bacterium RBG_13_43_8]
MRKRIGKMLFLLLPFAVGVIIGAGGIALWSAKSIQFIANTIDLTYLTYEIEEANKQYLYPTNIDTSIYAMQHLITFMEECYVKNIDTNKVSKNYFHDLAVAYVRQGNLYEKKGNKEKALQNFGKGLKIISNQKLYEKWKGTEKEIKTVDDLKKFVAELDNRLMTQPTF